MNGQINNILNKARNTISKFCMDECKAYCCRKGYLVLTPKEMELTLGDRKEEYINNRSLKKLSDGNYSLYLNISSCPSLKDNKCIIHKNPNRSQTCKVFPIHVKEGKIYVSKRCLAAKKGKLYPYISELINLGFVLK